MGLGNTNSYGNKKSNFNYQKRNLQIQGLILAATIAGGGGGAGNPEVPSTIIRATGPGVTPANLKSVSVYNAGGANGVFNGGIIKSGEQFSFSAQDGTLFLNPISYDGTGTELAITYII